MGVGEGENEERRRRRRKEMRLKFLGWGEEKGFYGCEILSPCGKRLG